MRIGIDTNVLLGAVLPGTERARRVEPTFANYDQATFYCAPQSIYEAFVVLTRPIEVNGYGLSPDAAAELLTNAFARFPVLPDPADLHVRWLRMCREFGVRGKAGHDARIAAWVLGCGLDGLFTLDPGGFARYPLTLV